MPFVEFENCKLHYKTFGEGKDIILAFHGYGQESGHFLPVAHALHSQATLFAFDLFFHGQSKLPKSKTPLQKEYLKNLFNIFLQEKKITRFSVMAFSMGGKFALALIEIFPALIDKVVLVAPDGIKTNLWYSLATYPGWLQGLFKRTVLKPVPLFKLISFLEKRNLVDKGLLRFANWHMDSTGKRLRVYKSWIGYAALTFDIRKIVGLLNQNKISVTLFLGEYDQVIPQHSLQVFVKALHHKNLVLLKTGHTYLLHEVAGYLRRHPEVF